VVDVAMILAPLAIGPRLLLVNDDASGGFAEFTLIYFSLVQGWLLYTHHFKGRFNEESRVHMLLQCLLIVSIVGGVWTLLPSVVNDSIDEDEDSLTRRYQLFSIAMGLLRLSIFLMFARVAMHVWRAAMVCLMMTFFLSNSFMCFTLASISDRNSIRILWATAALVESFMEIVVSLCLSRQNYVPVAMPQTLDRFAVIMVAPLGSIVVASVVGPVGPIDEWSAAFRFMSFCMLLLFAGLYYQLKDPVSYRLGRSHPFVQTLGLFHLKILGLALWVVGAALLVLIPNISGNTSTTRPQNDQHLYTQLLGLSFLVVLVLMFAWKSCGGQPYQVSAFAWIVAINGALCIGTILSPKVAQPLQQSRNSTWMVLCSHVGLLLVLNLVEALRRETSWMEVISSWIASSVDDRLSERTVVPRRRTRDDVEDSTPARIGNYGAISMVV
jgi:hypothetical protein